MSQENAKDPDPEDTVPEAPTKTLTAADRGAVPKIRNAKVIVATSDKFKWICYYTNAVIAFGANNKRIAQVNLSLFLSNILQLVLSRNESELLSIITLKTKESDANDNGVSNTNEAMFKTIVFRRSRLQYYDDDKRFWSIRFPTQHRALDFIKILKELNVIGYFERVNCKLCAITAAVSLKADGDICLEQISLPADEDSSTKTSAVVMELAATSVMAVTEMRATEEAEPLIDLPKDSEEGPSAGTKSVSRRKKSKLKELQVKVDKMAENFSELSQALELRDKRILEVEKINEKNLIYIEQLHQHIYFVYEWLNQFFKEIDKRIKGQTNQDESTDEPKTD